jgi:sugar lactone lactonase YvrE
MKPFSPVRVAALLYFGVFLLALISATPLRADILYVANSGNSSVEKYSGNGTDMGAVYTNGTNGASTDAVAFDSAGDLFVSYSNVNQLIKITPMGVASVFASVSTGGIAVDSSGNIYVAEFSNIEKYSPTGTDLGAFATTGVHGAKGLAFDSSGNLYVANFSGNNILKFSPTGTSLGVFASAGSPIDLAFDRTGKLYVSSGDSILQYSSSGTLLNLFGDPNSAGATGLAFDSTGQLYVSGSNADKIEKFSTSGTDLGTFASDSHTPSDLAFTDNLGNPLILPGGEAVPEPATWAASALATLMLTVQIFRAAAFSKRSAARSRTLDQRAL